jgi:tetratricopeptide (TPR) repeat protein
MTQKIMTQKNVKFSTLKTLTAGASILLGLIGLTNNVQAQVVEPWTGAIVGSTIDLGNGGTLAQIRDLINQGKTEDAVRISKKFIQSLEQNKRSGKTTYLTYDAYNALCISLTANKNYSEAMDACNAAIKDNPKRWQAFNSRGSLNYKTEKYAAALNDYKEAQSKAPSSSNITNLITHNIKISQDKIASN